MQDTLRFKLASRKAGQVSMPVVFLAGLLIGIRLIAGAVSETCFFDLELSNDRTVHIHGVDDHGHCPHGRFKVSPIVAWACSACQDHSAYSLPEIPSLPILVSFFIPLFLLTVSFGSRPLIVAHGRGPPLLAH